MNKDIIVSLVCLAGAAFLYYSLGWIDEERAMAFPRVVIIIIGCLSLLLFIQTLIIKKVKESSDNPFPWGRFITVFIIIIVYFFFMEKIGFYVSAFLLFVAITMIFGRAGVTVSKAVSRVAFSVAFTGVIYVLFKIILKVQTPTGVFF